MLAVRKWLRMQKIFRVVRAVLLIVLVVLVIFVAVILLLNNNFMAVWGE